MIGFGKAVCVLGVVVGCAVWGLAPLPATIVVCILAPLYTVLARFQPVERLPTEGSAHE